MINDKAAAKGRRAPRRPYRFGTRDIALAAGKSVASVRKDRQRGKVDPSSLPSIVAYIAPPVPCCPHCRRPY